MFNIETMENMNYIFEFVLIHFPSILEYTNIYFHINTD